MKRILAGLSAVLVLGACVQPAEITQDPVSAQLVSGVGTDRLAEGTSKMTVRSFAMVDEDGKQVKREIVGATCSLVSDELRAKVVTPQVVILPKFKQRAEFDNRGVPGSISVTCNGGGKTGSTLLTAAEKQVSTSTGGGAAGAIVTLMVSAALASATPWVYPPFANVTVE